MEMAIFMTILICVFVILLFLLRGWCCNITDSESAAPVVRRNSSKRSSPAIIKKARQRSINSPRRPENGPSVTVTTSTQPTQSPQVVPPYPIDARHPTPHVNAPGLGFATHQPPYPTQPAHPTPYNQTVTHYGPLPPPMGITGYPMYNGAHHYPPAAGTAPYPPTTGPSPYNPTVAPYPPAGDYNAHPPPYDVAVSSPPMQPALQKDGYVKQAPYNPHYN